MVNNIKPNIRSLLAEEIESLLKYWGQPAYRTRQLLQWLYKKHADSWSVMGNLPASLKTKLSEKFEIRLPQLVTVHSSDNQTYKFVWKLEDGFCIESVLLPASPGLYGEANDRRTLCVSTQVGCAFRCNFCASGLYGLKRNLQPHEIVGQVLATEKWFAENHRDHELSDRIINNIVVMGIGEPFANYSNLMTALKIINAPWGCNIGARKITVSTCGLPQQIRKFADEPYQFRLSISLHAVTDELRNKLMPVNKKYPLNELIDAMEYYSEKKGKMITLEYVLIDKINDRPEDARRLAQLARRLHARVNLIPLNPIEKSSFKRSSPHAIDEFIKRLNSASVTTTLRAEKGTDINGACGQLRLHFEK